jgi:septum site-determining protein MinD
MLYITAFSFKGGTGKTNVIASLAYALASAGYRVGIVDSDMAHPSLHVIFGMGDETPKFTLTDFLFDNCKATDIVYDISSRFGVKGKLYIVPSDLNEETIMKIVEKGFYINTFLDGLKEIGEKKKLDFMLIDTRPSLDDRARYILLKTNMLLVVMRNDDADIRGTVELMKIVDDYTIGRKYIQPNMTDPDRREEIRREIKEKFRSQDVEVLEPISYDNKLSMVHSPRIDDLYMHKFPEDGFSKCMIKLRDKVISDAAASKKTGK